MGGDKFARYELHSQAFTYSFQTSILLIDTKGIEPTLGSFHKVSDPRPRGVKITKIEIVPKRDGHSFCPFGESFW